MVCFLITASSLLVVQKLSRANVSVLIAARGKCPYLDTAVVSALNALEADDQIVLVDNGLDSTSLNAVRKIFKRVENTDIVVIEHPSPGLATSLNAGLDACKHEFVARLDADDAISPQRLALQSQFLMDNPDYVLVGSAITVFGDISPKIVRCSRINFFLKLRLLSLGRGMAHPSIMFRKKDVLNVGGYNPVYVYGQDIDLWCRLFWKGKFGCLLAPLTSVRRHSDQISVKHTALQVGYGIMAVTAFWIRFLRRRDGDLEDFITEYARIIGQSIFFNFYLDISQPTGYARRIHRILRLLLKCFRPGWGLILPIFLSFRAK